VASFASDAECAALVAATVGIGNLEPRARTLARMPVADLAECAHAICDLLLRRALRLVEAELPVLATSWFGQSSALAEMEFAFSMREPAVNEYCAGGEFEPHTDKQHLTVLVPLSDPASFSGGGTAFWACTDATAGDRLGLCAAAQPPVLALRSPVGTALLFGGDVTHAGLPVLSGTRHVFVASFSLSPRRASPSDDGTLHGQAKARGRLLIGGAAEAGDALTFFCHATCV
jgi:hypothetical protein